MISHLTEQNVTAPLALFIANAIVFFITGNSRQSVKINFDAYSTPITSNLLAKNSFAKRKTHYMIPQQSFTTTNRRTFGNTL
jgi:hypothetical protein